MIDFNQGLTLYDHPEIVQRLFFPRRDSAPDTDRPRAVNHVVTVAQDIRIACRFYPSHPDAPNILYFHGNGETASDYDFVAPLYNRMQINLFVTDYRGYGMSDGRPTCSTVIRDAHALFHSFTDFLTHRGFSGSHLVMGRSLGSAPAIEIARHYQTRLKGLVVESGFASARNQLCRIGMAHLLQENPDPIGFGNDLKIGDITLPTLIIHGEEDEIIPVTEGRILYTLSGALRKSTVFIPRAGHNDILIEGATMYLAGLSEFIQEITGPNQTAFPDP